MKKLHFIYIPGLGDKNILNTWFLRFWELYRISYEVVGMPWYDKSEEFSIKLQRVLDRIDIARKNKKNVVLLGVSAGASAALNAYCQRRNDILAVINVCGRLREGKGVLPTLDFAARKGPAFKESVLRAEKNGKSLTKKDKEKMLTIRPLYDEIVPSSTVAINGARNIVIPCFEHVFSIGIACTFYSKYIVDFAKRRA